ncbi:lamin tail domain-containing protein [Thermococcus sp. Bubb.Bath]|uniref:lamin tail domain-containing protein n=1 Tax=Thermococcus sp. Bubb.Bath TaxID=1638242 RepID=UPI00143AA7E7|nr:lamin tail domain-containing protein [Thermococcus sp. Bubb.Bath]NJF24938.1 nuclease [Thermococcus sp. Bubb.Bath]
MGFSQKLLTVLLLSSVLIIAGCVSTSGTNGAGTNHTPSSKLSHSQASTQFRPAWESALVYVTRVVDGDTAYVRFSNGTVEKVRFLGVDTPETELSRNRPNEYDHITDVECLTRWGLKAEDFTREELQGKYVYLVFDPISPRRGYYGRLLAYIYLTNGTDFTEELVRLGYARVYVEGKFKKKDEYLKDQVEAIQKGKGLWGACGTHTVENPGVVIVMVQYNAEGDDSKNLNGEYVLIKNVGSSAVNLEGWKLMDESGNTFIFPNVTLSPGEEVRVHSGKGKNTKTDLYWGSDKPIWNNEGDTAYLYDSNGVLVDSYRWG